MPLKDRQARIEWQREHYKKNKVVISLKAKEYRARNKEKIQASKRRYRAENKEKVYAAARRWVLANPEKTRASHRRSYRRHHEKARDRSYNRCLAKQYGLTREQYDTMAAGQKGLCAICGRPPSLRLLEVDHDHATGRIRGLLCRKCNVLIGYLETSRDVLGKVSTYLGWI